MATKTSDVPPPPKKDSSRAWTSIASHTMTRSSNMSVVGGSIGTIGWAIAYLMREALKADE